MILLAAALIGLGWAGTWPGEGRSAEALSPQDRTWIELVDSGRDRQLLVFPGPPTPAEVIQAAGVGGFVSSLPTARIPDGTRVVVKRSSGEVEWQSLGEGLSLALGRRMNVNRASLRDLALLPGVGPATARLIAADRTAKGPFAAVDDLIRVKGLGRKKVENLRLWVYTSGTDSGKGPDG